MTEVADESANEEGGFSEDEFANESAPLDAEAPQAPESDAPPVSVSLRKIAADCIKTVRTVVDSEEEAIEMVMAIWAATAKHIAASIRVGKSMSLMPLGVVYANTQSPEKEASLAMSELFVLQYGVGVKPGDVGSGPGPSTKPAYSDIAAVAHCPDKGLIPGVLTAVINRLGELCGQAPKVSVDFSPLGEIRCEDQHVEFISSVQLQAKDPAVKSPARTVHAVLSKKGPPGQNGLVEGSVSATTAAALGGARGLGVYARDALQFSPRAPTGVALAGSPSSPSQLVKEHSYRGQTPRGMANSDMITQMMLSTPSQPRNGTTQSSRFTSDPRLQFITSPGVLSGGVPGAAPPKTEDSSALVVAAPAPAIPAPAMLASMSPRAPKMLALEADAPSSPGTTEFVRNAPAKRQQFPPLLDEFSRTRAAPYGEELYNGSNCGRIGSHYSPMAAMLVWSDQMKCIKWKAVTTRDGKGSQAEEFGSDEAIEKEFANEQVVDGSPLALEVQEAGLSKRDFYSGLSRYRYYVSEGIKDSVVAPINEVWVRNVVYLAEAERFHAELGAEGADSVVEEVKTEMALDYLQASKNAIADYILKDARSCARARVSMVPSPVAVWGSVPFVGIEGTVGGPPEEWRADLASNKDAIVRTLTVYNQSSLHLLNLWFGSGYGSMLLVDLPEPASSLIEIDRFFEKQRTCCQDAVTRLKSQWLPEVCEIIRGENLHLGAASEAWFFKGISALLSIQLRTLVSSSAEAFINFMARFSNLEPMAPEAVTALKDTDEREDAFLVVKLEARGDEIRFRDPPERVHDRILRIFRDFVVCLNDMPTPQARMNRGNVQDKDKTLWPTMPEEQHITKAQKVVDRVVDCCLKNMETSIRLYDKFVHLLTEEERIREFIKDPSRTREEYLAKFNELKDTERDVRKLMPNEVRMQMVCVDCSGLNETLCSKANECVNILLENIVSTNFERNEKLCKSFENIIVTLGRKPTGAGELVELEHTLEVFRTTSLRDLTDEFQAICLWQGLLFDCYHLLQQRDFKAIADSASWVHRIEGQMNQREGDMRNERDIIENRFKQERQKFEEDLQSYSALVNKFKEAGNVKQLEEYLQLILSLKENFERAKVEAQKFREKETMLGWDPSEFERLTEGVEKLQPYDELWDLVHKFQNEEKRWMKGPLFSLQPEAVDQLANNMAKKAMKLQSLFDTLQLPTPAGVAKRIKRDLDAFKQHLPLIHALCNPGLRQRHWEEISEVVTFAMERDRSLTLSRVIDMEVGKYINELQEISDAAAREYTLETMLQSVEEAWEVVIFELKPWKDTETYVVAGSTVDEMQGLMDDHIIKMQTMKGSPYAKPFMEKITEVEQWLLNTQEIMDIWIKVQSVWLYLEPIFGSEDIVKQMPTEANLFRKVDAAWRNTMNSAKDLGKAKPVSKTNGLLQRLKDCQESLDTVQKGLNDYLETKRLAFPRFYFLSNDNLLEILSETKDPRKVNPHMKKAFEGIQSLQFEADQQITALISSEKEKVPLVVPVDPAAARGNVELWLIEVQAAMLETVRDQLMKSAENYAGRKFTEWLKDWPGQVVIAIFCLYWTTEVAQALKTDGNFGVRKYSDKLENQLVEIIDLVRSDIPKLVRCTLEALIVIFVHNRDTVVELHKAGIQTEDDFDWLVQLRYYIEVNPDNPERQDAFVRITNSFLSYAYEYIGNSSRLVVTPLTDRCYRTCCGALHLLYGAAPEGPAGTGKTETVKDLSKALARFCVVFNCSDELDFLAMAKFFKGLAASGGWACFDEFNRIDPEVLSVIAQQILCIQLAIKERKEKFEFEGTILPIIWTCNCFITMNPGYAGRAELPDNLKALFRTVAMMVPDYAMIAEIKLYAYGYQDSRNLAQKIVTTYKLCSEQLSSQKHYDYGMRAVFAVLVRAGSLKRSQPSQNESILMLQSINDVNLAKFLDFDVPLYTGITKDLFPGVELPKQDYTDLINTVNVHLEKDGCSPHPYFVEKIIQFYECHLVRHSVMLVGMPFSGKTTALNMLQRALTDLAQAGTLHEGCVVHQARLNPKSIPAKDLYGAFDDVSHEWADGIVAVLFREFSRNQTEERKWLVFDGPVDAVWIENMNTVMDENKKLCLNSGEIIAMSPNMRTVIEPMDVEVASPATISRNGMVFFEPHLMGFKHLVDKFFKCPLPEEMQAVDKEEARLMIDFLLSPLLKFVQESCKLVSPCQEQNLVQSFLTMLRTHLQLGFSDKRYSREIADVKTIASMIDSFAIFSVIWSLGAACETSSRTPFSQHLRKLLSGQIENCRPFKKFVPALPDRASVFDYNFSLASTSWVLWSETVEPQSIPNSAAVEGIIVQTVDNIRYSYILKHCIEHRIKLLFCGPTGTGKTVYMQQALMSLAKETHTQLITGFSAQTNCGQTQDLLDAKLERRRKGVFGPPAGKVMVVMVDDLNMPVKETYGAQPPIELLRQGVDSIAYAPSGGWFERKDVAHPFRSITDVLLFAAMGTPGGGRTFVTPRLLGHFCLIGFPLLDDDNMTQIFSTILDWKFRVDAYPQEVCNMSKKLVQATLEIYKNTAAELLPTPLKVHYTFNLRDFAKVIHGVLLLKKGECQGEGRHVRLWAHEILRVIGDRLIDDADRKWMLIQLREIVKKTFQASFDELFQHLDSDADGKVDKLDEIRTLFFGDLLSPAGVPRRPYTECPDVAALQKEVEGHLIQHNDMSNKPMDLVCFLYMLEHLSRIARVIKTPGGNALLVGLGGSGRQSCTRLACYAADFTVFQIEIVKGYGMESFREDMQKMLKRAGGEAEKTVFLFSDTQIKSERFVEDINNLLNTGEIPNVFPPDEKVAVCEMVRNAAKDEGKAPDGTPLQLFTYFVERCKANLSVVVCLSPIGDSWRTRLRQFPSLVNCCTIDWFTPWPADALLAVATRFLKTVPDLDDTVRSSCVEMCQAFHSDTKVLARRFQAEQRRYYYSTPTSYLELIQTFKHLLQEKRNSTGSLRSKYEVGLEKLTTTEQSVEGMKQDLIALQPQLVAKNKEVGEMMIVVNEESGKTEKVKEVVAADEAVASEAASKSNAIKEDCEKDLGEAMPALNEALKALDTLSSKEISEIKAMKNPPAPVRLVLSAVCVLRNIKPVRVKDDSGKMVDDYWPAAVKMISEMGFLQSLQTFDKDNIPPAIIQRVATYTCKEDFQPDRVERVSRAAWGLCMWVRAMEVYDRVAKVVAPKQESLREAEAEYNTVMAKLTEKRAELQKVVDELQALNEKLDGLRQEQVDLSYQVDLCKKKLERAETLIASLGGEKTRWTQNAQDLGEDYIHLTGDVIVASGLIAYLGAFTPEFREEAVKRWAELAKSKNIPGSAEFGLQHCLGEPVKVRAWIIAGLPNDSFSIENGIIVDKAHRWPLCIDPQSQANRWVKKMGQGHQIVVSKFTDADYLKRMEGCIQFGHPMLLENVGEETDPAVEPVLLRQTFKKGNAHMIKLGEAIIEWHPDFKFYLTTKLRNPHYLPEVAVKVTLLNFMITQVGLQDQLLNIVVERERPDLAEEKARLVIESAENKDQLEVTENKILNVLSSSSGNLLEDEAAVQVLSASKQLSNEIAEKQKVAEETERQIDEARLQYVPVASNTAILFFCIADLANIDPMYQYSLLFFINLFKVAIDKSEKADDIEQRIGILNSFFMQMLYNNICRSLFEKDKLLFSFLLTVRLALAKDTVRMSDYRFLLTGGVSMEEPPAKPEEWVPDRMWSELFRLSRADEQYARIQTTFFEQQVGWKAIYDAEFPLKVLQDPERQPAAIAHLDSFQQLLVLRCVRPDRVVPAILRYVSESIGERFVTPPPFDLQGSYADSSPMAPLIFILSPGSDPFSALNMFAAEKGKQVNSISLGQGQGPKAEKLMEEAMQGGGWVLLQNCHLATSWMPKLDKKLETLDPKELHHDYRLWLSSYPSEKFPVSILQSSVKITNEAPKGLRANLVGSFLMDPISSEDFFENCARPEDFKRLLFALCFFHAVIQERRLFGPLGWNIPYEFTQNDLRISVRQLRMFLDESPEGEVPFKALRYLTGECNYGGRVTDDKDRRLIITLLNDYYNADLLVEDSPLCKEHVEYVIPSPAPYEAMLEAVRGVPLDDPPGVFGFHPNANLTREQNQTYGMMDNLLLTVGSSSSSSGSSAEDAIGEVAADIMGRMPPSWKLAEVQEKYPTMYEESMNTVLIQELTRFNALIEVITSSLRDIQKATKGLLLMSSQLETVFNSILDGKTPQLWLSQSYPSLKPLGSYTNDLIERLKFFQTWVDDGIPVLFWLSGIYFTQAFTTGAAQNYARRHAIPIDTLTFDFELPYDQQPTARPSNGVYTYGVFLEGCKWDWETWELNESDPKVLFVPVPMIWIVPCKKADLREFPSYNCPLYKVSSRKGVLSTTGHSTNFVMNIRLPSAVQEAHWVKRGVAMLTSLDS